MGTRSSYVPGEALWPAWPTLWPLALPQQTSTWQRWQTSGHACQWPSTGRWGGLRCCGQRVGKRERLAAAAVAALWAPAVPPAVTDCCLQQHCIALGISFRHRKLSLVAIRPGIKPAHRVLDNTTTF